VYLGRGVVWQTACAYYLPEARRVVVGAMAPELSRVGYEIGRRGFKRGLVRRFGKRFKKRLNRLAKKLAGLRVLKGLRAAYAKVLQSPVASFAVKAASGALSAFGVPPKVSQLVLNAARNATVDRLKNGGWAGFAARATGKGGLRGAIREGAIRQGRAFARSARQTFLPGIGAADRPPRAYLEGWG
jgi:hypothetical protein